MKMTRWGFVALTALTVCATTAQAAGDAAAGKVKAYTCMGCHGVPGYNNVYPEYHVPRLGGQNADFIVSALKEYRSGDRPHPTMRGQALSMTDQDYDDISAWLATAAANKAGANVEGSVAKPDKVATCAACHGENGQSASPMYPNLGGQYANYIEQALHAYKSGKRKNAIMNGQAANLTDQEMKDLAMWFSSQKAVVYTPEIPGESK